MIEQIADLVDDFLVSGILGSNDRLGCFLSQFLEDLIKSLIKKVIGI